jgi:hypothetical protein
MFAWEQFGLTEDMYLKIYECRRNQHSDNRQSKERATIIKRDLKYSDKFIVTV